MLRRKRLVNEWMVVAWVAKAVDVEWVNMVACVRAWVKEVACRMVMEDVEVSTVIILMVVLVVVEEPSSVAKGSPRINCSLRAL